MNRRDFLRGALVLAPAVILTPGLLMRVKPIVLPSDDEIVRLLTETNDILRDMPFYTTVRVGLPSTYWRQLQDTMWPLHPRVITPTLPSSQ